MLTAGNRRELEKTGVTMVPNVISLEECDRYQDYYRKWIQDSFTPRFPQSYSSCIQQYRVGYLPPTWEVRLAAKPIFSQLWQTDKLLTSIDAIAIGRPPEEGEEEFWSEDKGWLHVDQTADRKGLHAYQGAVYLETIDKDDWTFEVIKGSHIHYDEFMTKTGQWRCKHLNQNDIDWFEERGCKRQRIPCPKGGMILWDSRLFHANARPLKGRNNPGRWRFVVFVCMAPAWWASSSDLQIKAKAYHNMLMTYHWPVTRIEIIPIAVNENDTEDGNTLKEMPDIAKSEEVQRLVGVLPYEDSDDDDDDDDDVDKRETNSQTNGAMSKYCPVWDTESWATAIENYFSKVAQY